MRETWIILGATSSIARAFARALSERGQALIVAGRDMDELRALAGDLAARGAAEAKAMRLDIREPRSFGPIIEAAGLAPGPVSVACFVGSMPTQAEIESRPELIETVIADNFAGPARFLLEIAPLIEARGAGTVVGVSSVAGDRGRLSNYGYGAAKAGFTTFLAGLRNRLTRAGAHVVTVKPGFTDTAMTWGVEGMFLVASPEKVAADILRAVEKRRNVIYTPGFWRAIMTIIRLVPEPIFKKLSI
ncbi:MAG: SDR family oxidoreductase [Alphaproteobacteria bacterium]|nr:MAG: SDR family oxidoreductase [Alphaproteobacteria bacterium]